MYHLLVINQFQIKSDSVFVSSDSDRDRGLAPLSRRSPATTRTGSRHGPGARWPSAPALLLSTLIADTNEYAARKQAAWKPWRDFSLQPKLYSYLSLVIHTGLVKAYDPPTHP